MLENLTAKSARVVQEAAQESRRIGHNHIGSEHILLGLMRAGGHAKMALLDLGLNVKSVRTAIESIIGQGDYKISPEIPFSERARKTIDIAHMTAVALGDNFIETEHLLIALTEQADSTAARVLESLGTSLSAVRAEVIAVSSNGPHREEAEPATQREPLEGQIRQWVTLLEAAKLRHDDRLVKKYARYLEYYQQALLNLK